MHPRYCSVTGALLASTAAATVIPGLPELREGEVYCIDDYDNDSEAVVNHESFTDGESLMKRLAEIANERDLGSGNYSCHNERPTVYIRRSQIVEFSVTHSIKFD